MEAHKPTVLLVDDEPQILAVLKRQLRGDDYRILTTSDPTEVLSILGNEPVDVLVSDVNMPEMSGVDLVSKVRASYPGVSRILLTGQVSIDVAVEAINRGEVFRYLMKPWAENDVRDAVRGGVRLAASARRTASIERAVARRARALEQIERRNPEIREVMRGGDGVYALPSSGRVDLVGRSADALAVLRELLEESPAPPPSSPRRAEMASAIVRTTGPATEASTLESAAAEIAEVSDVTTLPRKRTRSAPDRDVGPRVDGERCTQEVEAPVNGDGGAYGANGTEPSSVRPSVKAHPTLDDADLVSAPQSPVMRHGGGAHGGEGVPRSVLASRPDSAFPSRTDALKQEPPRGAMLSRPEGTREAMPSRPESLREGMPSRREAMPSRHEGAREAMPSRYDDAPPPAAPRRGLGIVAAATGFVAVAAAAAFFAWPRTAPPKEVPIAPVAATVAPVETSAPAPPAPTVTAAPTAAATTPLPKPTIRASASKTPRAPTTMGDLKVPNFGAP